ncbi:MAG: hypothetical protein KGY67_05770 [Candidatus Thermoplasmatota archaeon]|nr:hypothetical protein [Candidatus Thermoplasmatota archaeon]
MRIKAIVILFAVFILLSPQLTAMTNEPMENKQKIEYNQQHFKDLKINNSSINLTLNQVNSIKKNTQLFYQNQSFSITPKEIEFQNTDQTSITFNDATVFNQPGLPLIPMKTMILTLPKNISIQQIDITDYTLKKSSKQLTFQQTPKPHFWSINETPLEQHANDIIQESVIEAKKQTLYPGSSHSYTLGKNSTHTKAIIHLFPIQYQFDTKETFLITNGTITISYTKTDNQKSEPLTLQQAENIIITHPSFYVQAKKLQRFHRDQGTETELVTTNWIKSNYEPSEYPPVMGYKDFSFRDRIRKYDDELARKIISFLQSQSTNTDLQFITLFGNALHVPPSYYFGYKYYPVPTDFYYSSPDLDLIPNYRIGRLPVHNILEATRTVNKIINWNPTDTQMDNVAIAGGIPFHSSFFIGELITVDSVNRGFFDGLNLDKFYRTDERFENTDITSALQNDYGLLYMISHGNANLVVAEEGRISARNLIHMPKNDNAPIFSCIACSSGSYDTHLIKQGFLSMDKTSFGEGMVVSKGGGIAYIGGSRTNNGYPILTLNNGRVKIVKETYMAGLLTYVNQAYKNNVDNLGDLTFFAYETYLENNDLTDYWNQYHYFDFVLLGDPALQLPERSFTEESYQQPETIADEPVGFSPYSSASDDYNGTIAIQAIDEKLRYESNTDSPFINFKQIETGHYQNVKVNTSTHATSQNTATIEFTAESGNMKLLRFETVDGKEDWLYYKPVRPVNPAYTTETTGFNKTRWNSIQYAIDHSKEYDPIYVFEGIYNESIIIDTIVHLQGENKTTTVIDGNGNDDVVKILSDGVIIEGFTIQHCGKNPWNAGISIQPKKSFKSLPIVIKDNSIQNNKNCGIYIDVKTGLLSPTITIIENEIIYNNYGIYIQNGAVQKEISLNSISGNNYGIYMLHSKKDAILANTIENNYIGLFLNDVKKEEIRFNNFIENTQHCQFTETARTKFDSNYWDNWIGHRFNRHLPIPKLINGFHTSNQKILSQFKIDFHPASETYIV